MGILINKDLQQDSELRTRITAELREKAERTSQSDKDNPDFVEGSRYAEGYRKTSKFSWFWVLLVLGGLIVLFSILLF